jgi:hypothetical protein
MKNDGHKVEGCEGKWIDVGTLSDPYKQICNRCRASRQKPADEGEPDVEAMTRAERRHLDGLHRIKKDLDAMSVDPVHQDEEGFWFWTDMEKGERYGPYETQDAAETGYNVWIDEQVMDTGGRNRAIRWFLIIVTLGLSFWCGWVARGL